MLVRFDPFRDVELFEEGRQSRDRFAALDAYRRGDRFFIHLDVPGVDPDRIEVTVEDEVLRIRAERVWHEREGDEIVACERPQGTFERQVYLGPGLDREHLEASCENGVLTVEMPVREAMGRHRVPITVAGAPSTAPAGPKARRA